MADEGLRGRRAFDVDTGTFAGQKTTRLIPKSSRSLLTGITGDKEIIREFDNLTLTIQKKGLRPGLRQAAKELVLKSARQNLRDQQEGGTGALSASLKVRAVKRSRTKFGSQIHFRSSLGDAKFYGLWLEFGLTKTSPPRRHKSGKSTGDLPAQPFLRPALYDNRRRIQKMVEKHIKRWIKSLRPVT